MSVAYDVRIKQSAWKQALQIYTDTKAKLEEERENQMESTSIVEQGGDGEAIDTLVQEMKRFLNGGIYNSVYERVVKLKDMLEDNNHQIDELLKRCEMFPDQLTSDSYESIPWIPSDNMAEINGGFLTGNYAKLYEMSSLCDEISGEACDLKDALNSIMDSCSNLVTNAGACQREVSAAYDKLNRVNNLKTALICYRTGLQSLEKDINVVLRSLLLQTEEQLGELEHSQDAVQKSVVHASAVEDGKTIQELVEYVFKKDIEDWSEADAHFVAQTLNDAIAEKDTELIEICLGLMMSEYYGDPTCTELRKHHYLWKHDYGVSFNVEVMEMLMEQLSPEDDAYYLLNRITQTEIKAIEVSQHGTQKDEPKVGKGVYNLDVNLSESGEIQFSINIAQQKQGSEELDIKNTVTMTVYNMDCISNSNMEELGYSEEEIQAMKMGAINDVDVEFLRDLSQRDYEAVFLNNPNSLSQDSIALLAAYGNNILYTDGKTQYYNEKHLESFINALLHTYPARCGEMGNNTVDAYLDILASQTQTMIKQTVGACGPGLSNDTEQDRELLDSLEREWINQCAMYGVWSTLLTSTQSKYYHNLDTNYHDGLYTYKIQDLDTSNLIGTDLDVDSSEGAGSFVPTITMNMGVYDQYGNITYHMIEDVKNNEGETIIENIFPVEQKQDLSVQVNWHPDNAAVANDQEELIALRDEWELEKAEAKFEASLLLLNKFPGVSAGIECLAGLYKGDWGEVITGGGSQVDWFANIDAKKKEQEDDDWYDFNDMGSQTNQSITSTQQMEESEGAEQSESEWGSLGADVINAIRAFHEADKKYQKALEEKRLDIQDGKMLSCVSGSMGGDVYVFDAGVYDPHILAKLNDWSKNGIGVITTTKFAEDIKDDIGYFEGSDKYAEFVQRCSNAGVGNEEVATCLKVMLYGNDFDGDGKIDCEIPLYQMDPIVFNTALYELSLAGVAIDWSELR